MAAAQVAPPLPAGFELDPPPPPGFELDAPAPRVGLPQRPVGVIESALRTAAMSAAPVVRAIDMAAAGLAGIFGDERGAAGIFGDMEQRQQRMKEAYAPQPGEDFSTAGQVAGGVLSAPVEIAGGLGLQRGLARAGEVVERGGTMGEAATAGGVTGAANVVANLLPAKAGGLVARQLEGAVARVLPRVGARTAGAVVGGATGGAIGAGSASAVTAAENAALPEGEQFADLQAEANPAVAGGLGAAIGALAGGRAPARGLRTQRAAAAPAPVAEPTPGTQASGGAAGTDMAAQRRARAQGLPVPFEGDAALTKGQATRDFDLQHFEKETAKDPDIGQPLRERAANQNEVALRNLDALEAFTGAKKADRGAGGHAVVDAIAEKAQRAKKEISQAYDDAREAGEMAEPVDVAPLARWIEENRSSSANAGVIGTAEAELQRLGGARKAADGSLVPGEITLNDLEELRKKVVAGGKKDLTNAHFAAEINRVIDSTTERAGGDLYKAARAKFRDYQAEFKERGAIRDLIGIKKGSSDRITATEKVLDRAMSSADDLRNVRETLTSAGEGGVQAWREVQGMAMRKLRDEVTKGVATDIRGNPIVSPAQFKRVIDDWDRNGLLEVMFDKKGAETMRDLRDAAVDLFTAPPGAVNTSGTGARMAKWFGDMAASYAATGVPIPLVGLTKAAWKARADRKVKKQIRESLADDGLRVTGETPNPFEGTDRPPEPKAAAAGTKPAAAEPRNVPRETAALLQEIDKLREGASPETLRVLDTEAKRLQAEARAAKAAAQREVEVGQLERAAAAAETPALRQALQDRANALRAEKIPTGDAKELDTVPTAAAEKARGLPVGEAAELTPEQLAQAKPTRRERDLLLLREEAADPEIVKDLDREIAAERKRGADAQRGREYLRLADAATDPELRSSFEAKAKKLGVARDAIPAGEAAELPVETVEAAPVPDEVVALPQADLDAWSKKWGFGALDAQAARDVREAWRYDPDAVERVAQQHARSPVAFGREIGRILEEGKTRASETQRAPGSSEGPGGPRGGARSPGEGSEGDGGTPVDAGGGRPRAPDGQGGGGGAPRPAEEVAPTARAQAKARADFDRATEPTGNPITDRFSAKLRSDYEGAQREYAALPDSRGGVVLNTDIARELSPDYLADRTRSADVHEPASNFIKRVYADRLAAPTPAGRERVVMFSAGGTGAGKTTAIGATGDALGKPELIYDTNMNGVASSIDKIDQALAAGRNVLVTYVYADPVAAFRQAIARTLRQKATFGTGRTVPIGDHIATHVGSSRAIRDLADRYRHDQRVQIRAVDNSRGPGEARLVELAELPLVADNGLREQFEAIAREARRSGRIDEATLAGYLGEQQSASPRLERVGEEVRGRAQPGGSGREQARPPRLTLAKPARPAPAARPTLSGPVGSSTSVVTERGMRVPVRYRLADVGDLVTSHTDELKPNAAFDQRLQPRDRSRDSSEAQIARIQNALQPELLADSPKASDGSPIVGDDGQVESGNARTIALRRAYAAGQADAYRAWLLEHAERFGLTADQVRGLRRPVLVRERTVGVDRADFARQANESPVSALSETEQAFSDATRLPDLEALTTNDDGTVNISRSADFIREFMREVPSNERNQLMTADGRLSQRGAARIRNAVFARAYGDSELVASMAESTDGNVRNVMAGLLRSAPTVARVRELADAGARRQASFIPELVEAVRRYAALREEGATVSQGLAQGDLLGGAAPEPVADLMRELEVNARAPRRIADMVARLAGEVDAAGDPRQSGLDLEP